MSLFKFSGKRVKTPVVMQMEAVECGAASLAIILSYYGKHVPLEELRIACGVTRDGSNAYNVLSAAKEYGLEAGGFKMDMEDLKDEDVLPTMLFWDFHHFVVFEGFKKDKFYLNDPAIGHRIITEKEFSESFTGVVLTFEPSATFAKGGRQTTLLSMMRHWIKGTGSATLFFILTGLFLVVPGIILPVFSKIFIDDIVIGSMKTWAMPLLAGMLLTALARGGLTWLQNYFLLRFEEKLAIQSSARLVYHILHLPIQFFSQRYSGEIGSRIAINNTIAQFLARNLSKTLLNVIMILFFAAVMFHYNTLMASVAVVIVSLNIVFLLYISKNIRHKKLRLMQERGKLMGTTSSGLMIIETLKASGSEKDFLDRYTSAHARVISEEQGLNSTTNLLMIVPQILLAVNNAVILLIGSLEVMKGNLSIGMLVAFQSIMSSFSAPVNMLVQLGGQIQEMNGNIKRVEDIFNNQIACQRTADYSTSLLPAHTPQHSAPMPSSVAPCAPRSASCCSLTETAAVIQLNNITFGYGAKDNPVITGFSMELKKWGSVAIIGRSGSGKSTVARLIAGLYQPWSGEIEHNYSALSVVDQPFAMYSGTIRENITMWNRHISDDAVIRACKDACLHEVITRKSGGYDHPVEENGKNFSGGEKQRIEIARALAKNPDFLILDEATSALDPATEKEVMDNIKRRNISLIIIAHRLSTVRDCDEIIVLEKGTVIEKGNHDELIALNGYYARQVAQTI